MRNDKPEPTIPVDNIADGEPTVWHWHVPHYGPVVHVDNCHGTDAEAARRGYVDLLDSVRSELAPCAAPGENGRCDSDECWTCTSNERIDKEIEHARTMPLQVPLQQHYAYTVRPLGERCGCSIYTVPTTHCRA